LDIAVGCRDTAHLRNRSPDPEDPRVTIYLIRHAKAGDRDTWLDDDRLRPLSGRGHRQARLLVDLLADATFDRVLPSPPRIAERMRAG
jgi:8-oxo-(d)GTP phosphatase